MTNIKVKISKLIYELNNEKNSLFSGSFWAICNNIIRLCTGLISVPLTVGYLGSERYGIWMLITSSLAFVSFLDVGITPILKNRMTEAYTKKDNLQITFYTSSSILVTIFISILIIPISTLACSVNWIDFLKISDLTAKTEIFPLILIVQFISFLTLAFSIIDTIYAASLRISILKFYDCIASIVGFILLLISIKLNFGLPLLACLTSASPIIVRGILLLKIIKKQPSLINFNYLNTGKFLIGLIPTSALFMGIQSLAVVLYSAPNILITYFLNLSSVTYFNIVMRLIYVPLNLISALLPVFWPRFTNAWATGNVSWIRNKMLALCGWTCVILTTFSLVLITYGEDFIYKWTKGNVSVEKSVLIVACIWLLTQGCVHWLSTFLHSITDLRFEIFCYAITAIIFIGISYFVTPLYGVLGVLSSMCLSLLLGSFLPMMWRVKNKLA